MTPEREKEIRERDGFWMDDTPFAKDGSMAHRRELLAELDRVREAATKAAAELRHAIGVRHASGHTQWSLIDRAVRLLESAATPGEKP